MTRINLTDKLYSFLKGLKWLNLSVPQDPDLSIEASPVFAQAEGEVSHIVNEADEEEEKPSKEEEE